MDCYNTCSNEGILPQVHQEYHTLLIYEMPSNDRITIRIYSNGFIINKRYLLGIIVYRKGDIMELLVFIDVEFMWNLCSINHHRYPYIIPSLINQHKLCVYYFCIYTELYYITIIVVYFKYHRA